MLDSVKATYLLGAFKDIRDEKVQQRPKLVKGILEGRPRDEDPVARFEAPDRLGQGRGLVLEAVRLVQDEVRPAELLQHRPLDVADLVGGDAHVPVPILVALGRLEHVLGDLLARRPVPVELDDLDGGSPPSELVHPVGQRRLGDDDKVRPGASAVLQQVHQN
jgi:hypothetical protein